MARIQLPTNLDQILASPTIDWSPEQDAIFDWFESGSGNLVVRARAGTGKTTTLIEGVNRAPERRILMTAFNKSIAEELESRIENRNVRARTLHSLGFGFIRRHLPGVEVAKGAERARILANKAIRVMLNDDRKRIDKIVDKTIINTVAEINTKIREILIDPMAAYPLARRQSLLTDDERLEVMYIADSVIDFAADFGFSDGVDVEDFWMLDNLVEAALIAVELAKEPTTEIDYADMIFLPVVNEWASPICDLLVVDEAQDMSAAQLKLGLMSVSPNGRICICGDEKQAIYAFRGADSGSLDRLKGELHASELGLKTTYRCPKSVVKLARNFVRDYRAAETAPEGSVFENADMTAAEPGDFVLSRSNAGLVGPCLDLIRSGKRAYIKGSVEIGRKATRLARNLGDEGDLKALAKRLRKWVEKETKDLDDDETKAAKVKRREILEQAEILEAFIEGSPDYFTMLDNINTTFADTGKPDAIMCSTVHKAKGLEAPRVFLVVETFRRDGEEDNICYVAITRAKSELYLYKGDRNRLLGGEDPFDGCDSFDDDGCPACGSPFCDGDC